MLWSVAGEVEVGSRVRPTLSTVAELAGTTLHTVSRTLSGWEKDGIVLSAHRHVVVCLPEMLAAIREAAS